MTFFKKAKKITEKRTTPTTPTTNIPGHIVGILSKVQIIIRKTRLSGLDKSQLKGFRIELMGFSASLPTGNKVKDHVIAIIRRAGSRM